MDEIFHARKVVEKGFQAVKPFTSCASMIQLSFGDVWTVSIQSQFWALIFHWRDLPFFTFIFLPHCLPSFSQIKERRIKKKKRPALVYKSPQMSSLLRLIRFLTCVGKYDLTPKRLRYQKRGDSTSSVCNNSSLPFAIIFLFFWFFVSYISDILLIKFFFSVEKITFLQEPKVNRDWE